MPIKYKASKPMQHSAMSVQQVAVCLQPFAGSVQFSAACVQRSADLNFLVEAQKQLLLPTVVQNPVLTRIFLFQKQHYGNFCSLKSILMPTQRQRKASFWQHDGSETPLLISLRQMGADILQIAAGFAQSLRACL
jgi:hypothetical protein